MRRSTTLFFIIVSTLMPCSAEEIPLQPSREDTPRSSINYMRFSPDGSMLVTCTSDNKIHFWDPTTCKLNRVLSAPNEDRKLALRGADVSPDGTLIASLQQGPRNERRLLLWNAADGTYLRGLEAGQHQSTSVLSDLEFSPDGRTVWVVEGPMTYEWTIATGSVRQHELPRMLHGRLRFINDSAAWPFTA